MSNRLTDNKMAMINLKILENNLFDLDPSWLKSLRKEALQAFLDRGFPTRTEEAWKYIDLNPLAQSYFKMGSLETVEKSSEYSLPSQLQSLSHAPVLVFINGYFRSEYSNLAALSPEVIVCSFKQALEQYPDLVKQQIASNDPKTHPFVSLNTALLTDGVFLHIAKNHISRQPIHCIYLSDEEGSMSHTRNVLLIEENSHAIFVEHFIGNQNAQYFHNQVTQIHLEQASQLAYYKIQQESQKAYHLSNIQVTQRNASELSTFQAQMGGRIVREDLQVKLAGQGARCQIKGLYAPSGQQCIDHHLTAEHCAPQTQSEQHYKGILKDRSKAVFNGKVIVHETAKQTVARQANQNILLSNMAEVDTKPELEIYTDDVKCSHGATVGPLEQEAIFYLQTRGMSKELASHLLIDAFFNELIAPIPFPEITQKLSALTDLC